VFFALHPANDTPCAVSIGDRQRYCFSTVLRDPVVVMLFNLAQISPRPREYTATQHSFHVQGELHA